MWLFMFINNGLVCLCYTAHMEITLTLPDSLANRVAAWAQLTQQDFPKMVETALEVALPPLSNMAADIATLSDDQVLTLAEAQMDQQQGEQLAQLQIQQREEMLSSAEKQTLLCLMQQYNELWVRKSQALALAVQRGLLPPLSA